MGVFWLRRIGLTNRNRRHIVWEKSQALVVRNLLSDSFSPARRNRLTEIWGLRPMVSGGGETMKVMTRKKVVADHENNIARYLQAHECWRISKALVEAERIEEVLWGAYWFARFAERFKKPESPAAKSRREEAAKLLERLDAVRRRHCSRLTRLEKWRFDQTRRLGETLRPPTPPRLRKLKKLVGNLERAYSDAWLGSRYA